jgi:hypothetical protein
MAKRYQAMGIRYVMNSDMKKMKEKLKPDAYGCYTMVRIFAE